MRNWQTILWLLKVLGHSHEWQSSDGYYRLSGKICQTYLPPRSIFCGQLWLSCYLLFFDSTKISCVSFVVKVLLQERSSRDESYVKLLQPVEIQVISIIKKGGGSLTI